MVKIIIEKKMYGFKQVYRDYKTKLKNFTWLGKESEHTLYSF